jgi:hypothetical protein
MVFAFDLCHGGRKYLWGRDQLKGLELFFYLFVEKGLCFDKQDGFRRFLYLPFFVNHTLYIMDDIDVIGQAALQQKFGYLGRLIIFLQANVNKDHENEEMIYRS